MREAGKGGSSTSPRRRAHRLSLCRRYCGQAALVGLTRALASSSPVPASPSTRCAPAYRYRVVTRAAATIAAKTERSTGRRATSWLAAIQWRLVTPDEVAAAVASSACRAPRDDRPGDRRRRASDDMTRREPAGRRARIRDRESAVAATTSSSSSLAAPPTCATSSRGRCATCCARTSPPPARLISWPSSTAPRRADHGELSCG